MFGKNGNGQKEETQIGVRREAGDLEITLPNGPGVHGFSALPGKDGRIEAAAFDPESSGDVGMISGIDEVAEMQVAPEVARPQSERELPRVYGDAASAQALAPETGGEVLVIMHRGPGEAPNISRFDSEMEAQAFVEDLIGRGIEQGAIETFRASKLDFVVSFRPVVDFKE
jgi:hypothetical protein